MQIEFTTTPPSKVSLTATIVNKGETPEGIDAALVKGYAALKLGKVELAGP